MHILGNKGCSVSDSLHWDDLHCSSRMQTLWSYMTHSAITHL